MRERDEEQLDALMARLAEGDRAAFDPLFLALHPRALRLARARVGPDLAPDVAQMTLMKLFAHASDFAPGRPVLPWFYAVLANEVRAARRHQTGTLYGDAERLSSSWPDGGESAEAALARREPESALARAIGALDEASVVAIEALLGHGARPAVAPEVFRKRISRAYARLRIALGGYK